MKTLIQVSRRLVIARLLSRSAVDALLEEVRLSPKPGLVDSWDNGCHHDLTLDLMEKSAIALEPSFYDMALAAWRKTPSQQLREHLAVIGRYGEQTMLKATGNVNSHKGAIWTIGLLCAAASSLLSSQKPQTVSKIEILRAAGAIAKFHDRFRPTQHTKGEKVRQKYQVKSAVEEALGGFPSLRDFALPTWNRFRGQPENVLRLNVLLSLMTTVDDTCILHRGNLELLQRIKKMAAAIVENGGLMEPENWTHYLNLNAFIVDEWVSPGGSADLLAASIFIEKITQHFTK